MKTSALTIISDPYAAALLSASAASAALAEAIRHAEQDGGPAVPALRRAAAALEQALGELCAPLEDDGVATVEGHLTADEQRALIRRLEAAVLTSADGSRERAFFQRHLDNACALLARAEGAR
jgi:hypothetical protein